MVIWLASFPRSGNTFFRILLYHIYGFKTYSIYNDPLFEEIGASEVVGHEKLPASIDELDRDSAIYFVKTHDLPKDNKNAIYLIRDGRDALVSYAKYIRTFVNTNSIMGIMRKVWYNITPFKYTLKDCIVNNRHFGGWSNNVFSWTKRRKDAHTFVIRYEDLINEPYKIVIEAIKSLNLNISNNEKGNVPTFEELHNRWPNFFRKGKVSSWKKEMTEELHELFWKYHGEAMTLFGYKKNE